jgi:hypothetical protein
MQHTLRVQKCSQYRGALADENPLTKAQRAPASTAAGFVGQCEGGGTSVAGLHLRFQGLELGASSPQLQKQPAGAQGARRPRQRLGHDGQAGQVIRNPRV